MKKRITFFAFAAALAFSYSCSNDETVAVNDNAASNEISFRPLMNSTTRATSLELSNLQTDGFYVTATFTSGHTAYFANQLYKEETTNVWKPYTGSAYTVIYWPKGDDVLDFHAYAPNNAQLVVSNTNVTTLNGCPEYTVSPNATAADQVDFLYATLTSKDSGDGSMPLDFAHKESQISIQLQNTDAALAFTVSEVAICNIASSGIYKNRHATDPSTATTMAWGDFGDLGNYSQAGLTLNPTTAVAAGTSWILIPQALAKPTTDGKYASTETNAVYNGAYIKVKMKVQSATNASVYYAGSADTWVDAIWPISTNASPATWAEGTHYTYLVNLAGGGYFEKNQADPSGDGLDRVLNLNEITFATVTVSGWSNGGTTNVP